MFIMNYIGNCIIRDRGAYTGKQVNHKRLLNVIKVCKYIELDVNAC